MTTLPSRIKPCCITAHIAGWEGNEPKYLMIRRTKILDYGMWQPVTGGIEEGETPAEAALREIFEETGLVPSQFYRADHTEMFYSQQTDTIIFSPVFIAFVEGTPAVKLHPDEHDAYEWTSYKRAKRLMEYPVARQTMDHVHALVQSGPITKRLMVSLEPSASLL